MAQAIQYNGTAELERGLRPAIAVIMEQRYAEHAQPGELIRALCRRDASVRVLLAEVDWHSVADDAWLEGVSLVVARGRSWPLLCMLTCAERHGITTINSRAAIAAVHNKAEMAVALATRRISTPATFVGSPWHLARSIPADLYPVVLKPVFGDNGAGIRLVMSAEELRMTHWSEPIALAQRFVPHNGTDLKLYCIGDDVWAVRKACPVVAIRSALAVSALEDCSPEAVPVTPELRQLATSCRRLFGLDLCGIDCVETAAGPVVIEINDFPNYSAVAPAGERLADYVCHRAQEATR